MKQNIKNRRIKQNIVIIKNNYNYNYLPCWHDVKNSIISKVNFNWHMTEGQDLNKVKHAFCQNNSWLGFFNARQMFIYMSTCSGIVVNVLDHYAIVPAGDSGKKMYK